MCAQSLAKVATGGVNFLKYAFISISKALAAGGIAGAVSRTAVAPLERLKILLQLGYNLYHYFPSFYEVQNPHSIKYNGTIQVLKCIWQTEGFHGLCKGNGSNCARVVPNSAVKFFSYQQASKGILWLYQQQTGNAGAWARIIAMSATYPMDLVRGRIPVQTDKSPTEYRGIFHALRTVLREEGARALYKGWLPSVTGVVPYMDLNFAVYESLKEYLVKENPLGLVQDNELSVTTRLVRGGVAGTVGQNVAYPLNVIRQRPMVGWKDASKVVTGDGRKVPLEYTGMVDAFQKTVKYEGVGGGLVPVSVKGMISVGRRFFSTPVSPHDFLLALSWVKGYDALEAQGIPNWKWSYDQFQIHGLFPHPHSAVVWRSFYDEGRLYIIMEFCRGFDQILSAGILVAVQERA